MRSVTVADSRIGTWVAGACLCLLQLSQPAVARPDHSGDSRWVSGGIVIDGNNDEWPMPFPFVAKDARVQYSIANDGKTLYLCVKASDEVEKKKLIVNGLTLMLDTAGDKEQKFLLNISVVFRKDSPDDNSADEPRQMPPGGNPPKDGRPPQGNGKGPQAKPPVPLLLRMHTTGMAEDQWQTLAPESNILAAVGVNDFTELVWEIAIPFSVLGWSALPVDPEHELSVGMLINGVDDGDLTPAHLPGDDPAPLPQQENAMKVDGQEKAGTAGQKPGGRDGASGGPGGGMPSGGESGGMPGHGGHSREMEQEEQPVSTASYADERLRLAHSDKIWKNIRLKGNSQ